MYDGGSDVTGYVVEILEEGTEQWYRASQKILTTNVYTAAGLTSTKKYRFRVAGVNALGTGEFSEGSMETAPSERIGKSYTSSCLFLSTSFKTLCLYRCTINTVSFLGVSSVKLIYSST